MNSKICWARKNVTKEEGVYQTSFRQLGVYHWSRLYEYPWIISEGKFTNREWVLDAGGGDGPLQTLLAQFGCQVVNIDKDPNNIPKDTKNIIRVTGDIRQLNMASGVFDKVMCVSVLEHIVDPLPILDELWRMVCPQGKLFVTIDVADFYKANHTIDVEVAEKIVNKFDLTLPPEPSDILSYSFPEVDESRYVLLKVLCFWVEKP